MINEFWKVYDHMKASKETIKIDHYTYSTLISVAARSLPWYEVENVLHGAIEQNLATNYVFSSLIKELKKRKNQLDNDYVFPLRGTSLLSPIKEKLSPEDSLSHLLLKMCRFLSTLLGGPKEFYLSGFMNMFSKLSDAQRRRKDKNVVELKFVAWLVVGSCHCMCSVKT